MPNLGWRLSQLIQFYTTADTIGNIHSPQIYSLLSHILDRSRVYYDFAKIENFRKASLENKERVYDVDYGAGSSVISKNNKSVEAVTRSSVSSARQCQILYRLVTYLKPRLTLELGSSVGISTCYLAKAYNKGKVISLEGNPSLSKLAGEKLTKLNIQNAQLVTGRFADTLPVILDQVRWVDLVFMDGHHEYEPTIQYYQWIKPMVAPSTVLVLDDIYWSKGMLQAWKEIIAYPEVTFSVDFFEFGMIFFNPSFRQSNHLRIVDRKFKPWK